MEEVHLGVLLVTVVGILWADHVGFQYFRGQRQTLPAVLLTRLHYAVLLGLVGMLVTGGIMAADRFTYLSAQPVFWLKMGFVAVLVINAICIGTLMRVATETPFASLPRAQKLILSISAALSGLSWAGAAIIGLFFL